MKSFPDATGLVYSIGLPGREGRTVRHRVGGAFLCCNLQPSQKAKHQTVNSSSSSNTTTTPIHALSGAWGLGDVPNRCLIDRKREVERVREREKQPNPTGKRVTCVCAQTHTLGNTVFLRFSFPQCAFFFVVVMVVILCCLGGSIFVSLGRANFIPPHHPSVRCLCAI